MTLISIEEAKTRLADCNVLLKYMSFLQKNGLSDCGRGQIMGQASLLMEHLKEKEQRESKQWTSDKSSQQEEEQREKQQRTITKDADKAGRIITAAFQENIVNNISKSDLLRQVGNAVDKLKETTVEQNNELKKDGLNKQVRQAFPLSVNATTTQEDNNQSQQQIDGARTNNKETDKSWINKIKKAAEVENWRSWQ